MVISAKKFEKLRNKLEKKIIGTYGSSRGLGSDLEVQKYTVSNNIYGDDETLTYDSSVYVKGIVVNSTDNRETQILNLNVREGEIRLYIPVDTVVDNTESERYKFVFDGTTYILVYSNKIGQVANIAGVVKEITLKPEN